MSSGKKDGVTAVQSINLKSNWTHCQVALWHSVRDYPYWLAMDLHFSNPDDSGAEERYYLGIGGKEDHKEIFRYLAENGFQQESRRVVQEWEYYEFARLT